MTREEAHSRLMELAANYPTDFRFMKQEVKDQMEEVIFREFSVLPNKIMNKPFVEAIRKHKNTVPTVEDLKDELKRLVFYLRFQINQTADILSDQTEEEKNEVNRLCREIGGVVPEDEVIKQRDIEQIRTMEALVTIITNYFKEKGETNV